MKKVDTGEDAGLITGMGRNSEAAGQREFIFCLVHGRGCYRGQFIGIRQAGGDQHRDRGTGQETA
jgi:hypothetical protein